MDRGLGVSYKDWASGENNPPATEHNMTKRITIDSKSFEASHPTTRDDGATTWMVSPIGRRGQPLAATFAALETVDGRFRLGGRMF